MSIKIANSNKRTLKVAPPIIFLLTLFAINKDLKVSKLERKQVELVNRSNFSTFTIHMNTCILAIESSCDDTSAAICLDGKILANITASQAVHAAYGGVFPEFASRAHMQHILPVVDACFKKSGIDKSAINAVAFTRGPGLIGSLHVGVSFAKAFALAKKLPLIEVNHMQAHILAHFIDAPVPSFPFLCLTVSGGHTQMVLVKDYLTFELLGETYDDAAGEAYDKIAKIFQLPYPGGPLIDKYAQTGDANKFAFPFPTTEGFNFSFSGLKTNVLYFIQKEVQKNPDFIQENIADLCASIQYRINSILISKLNRAAKAYKINHIAIAGGVSANSGLRKMLEELGQKNNYQTFIPAFQYCTDNAGMIAIAAYYKYLKNDFAHQGIEPIARWAIDA